MKKQVIVIGAGPAGLTFAYELLKRSDKYNVTILELSNDIGGISKTVNYKGNRMDIGGHRFFSKDQRIIDLWQEIMPIQGSIPFDYKKCQRTVEVVQDGPNPDKEDNVMLVRNRISRIFYMRKFFDYPISMKWETFKNLGFVKTVSGGFSYLKSVVFKKKEDSLENFYINRFGKKLYSIFFRDYTYKLWGVHPKNIDASWGAQRVKGLSITKIVKEMFKKLFHIKSKNVETSLIEEYYYPKFGPGEFYEAMADRITEMGGVIIKNAEVNDIKFKNDEIVSVSANGITYKTALVVSSMPIKDLIPALHGNKTVPNKISYIAKNLPYRDFITVGVLIDKLKIKNNTKIKTMGNIIPDCWIYIQEPDVKLLRVQIFNNWSPYMVKDLGKSVWIGAEYTCNEGDELWSMKDRDLSQFVTNELVKIGFIDAKDVKDTHIERVKKAYPSYFDTYKNIDKVIKYLNKFDNLYCVGRNGQHRYNNMDHSMLTSIVAVDHILNKDKDKTDIWQVNTEAEYHEEKKTYEKNK